MARAPTGASLAPAKGPIRHDQRLHAVSCSGRGKRLRSAGAHAAAILALATPLGLAFAQGGPPLVTDDPTPRATGAGKSTSPPSAATAAHAGKSPRPMPISTMAGVNRCSSSSMCPGPLRARAMRAGNRDWARPSSGSSGALWTSRMRDGRCRQRAATRRVLPRVAGYGVEATAARERMRPALGPTLVPPAILSPRRDNAGWGVGRPCSRGRATQTRVTCAPNGDASLSRWP